MHDFFLGRHSRPSPLRLRVRMPLPFPALARNRTFVAESFPAATIKEATMPDACTHLDQVRDVDPRTPAGCEECLAEGGWWVHLRLCQSCGHVGCCDNSPNRHATKHFH